MSRYELIFLSTNRSDFSYIIDLLQTLVSDYRSKFKLKLIFIDNYYEYKNFSKNPISKKLKNYFLKENTANFYKNFKDIYIKNKNKKFTFIIGDRKEMMIYANLAYFFNSKIIHIGGGENTPNSPDQLHRNIISSISDLHFCSNLKAKRRVKKHTKSHNVYVIGVSSSQILKQFNYKKKKEIEKKYKINLNEFALFCYHSENENQQFEKRFLLNLFKLLRKYNIKTIITSSNNDFNGTYLNKIYESLSGDFTNYIPNLGFDEYRYFIKNCKFMIGNSSSGIVESNLFDKLSLNIGYRQQGRDCDQNVKKFNFDLTRVEKFLAKKKYYINDKKTHKIYSYKNSTNIIMSNLINYLKI